MTDDDRRVIIQEMRNFDKVIIVHGTDTMDVTAMYLAKNVVDKTIILTGAMKPFSIEPVEATSNLSISLNFLINCHISDIFIGMHGLVEKYTNLKKNKQIGKFELFA